MAKQSIKKDFWFKHIENWRTSGLTQKEYCQQEKLSPYSFTSWRTIFLKPKNDKPSKPEAVTFLPAKANPKRSAEIEASPAGISVILPNQIKLLLPPALPKHELLSFLRVLGEMS